MATLVCYGVVPRSDADPQDRTRASFIGNITLCSWSNSFPMPSSSTLDAKEDEDVVENVVYPRMPASGPSKKQSLRSISTMELLEPPPALLEAAFLLLHAKIYG